MPKIIQSAPAKTDLFEIWLYIAVDNPKAADRVLSAINDKCKLLAKSPQMGRRREELSQSLRSMPEGKYIIFYRPIKGGIEIVRVLHGAQDIESIFIS
jgi:toxin ParE1/3/4